MAMVKAALRGLIVVCLTVGAVGHEISSLPAARFVNSELRPGAGHPSESKLPETLEDLEARWLGSALTQVAWVLSESPLSCAQKATAWLLDAHKEESQRAQHQTMALSLLSTLGMTVGSTHHSGTPEHVGFKVQTQRTMFGGIPFLLIIPVVLGLVLTALIQVVSLYSEWQDRNDKLARGEPLEADYDY